MATKEQQLTLVDKAIEFAKIYGGVKRLYYDNEYQDNGYCAIGCIGKILGLNDNDICHSTIMGNSGFNISDLQFLIENNDRLCDDTKEENVSVCALKKFRERIKDEN